jgi:hypothetical protein
MLLTWIADTPNERVQQTRRRDRHFRSMKVVAEHEATAPEWARS